MRAALALLCLCAAAAPPGAAQAQAQVEVRNRLSGGLMFSMSPWSEQANLELLLGERFGLTLPERGGVRARVGFAGRLGVGLLDGRVRRGRLTQLSVGLQGQRWRARLGRFGLLASYRLVDGGEVLFDLGRGVEVGGWLGEVPDLFSTAPAPRFGGGPVFAWTHPKAQVSAAAEVAGTATGLDRAGVLVRGRWELGTKLEVAGRVDLQYGGPTAPVHPADLSALVTATPLEALRLRARWTTYSGLAWAQGVQRDPALDRFRARYGGDLADFPASPDLSLHHQIDLDGRWLPPIAELSRFRLDLRGRYRHHAQADRRHARAAGLVGLEGLGRDRLDVLFSQGAVLWNGAWRSETGLNVRFRPDKAGRIQLDTAVRATVQPKPGGAWAAIYADAFVDFLPGRGVSLSVGYRFTDERGPHRWNPGHVGLLRASWSFRKRGRARPEPKREQP